MTQSSGARHLLLLVIGAACFFLVGLGSLPLLEPDEGRNAEVAREMLASGDWITPHFNALPYLDKPALFFWLVAGSFRLWGVSEWAARFPSALMALGTTLLVWFLARRMFGDPVGLRAGVILAGTPLVIAFSRQVIFDMTLTFLVALAMLGFWFAEAGDFRRARFDLLSFAAMGLATITKGPVGFLLPLLSILTYLTFRGRIRELKRLRWSLGLAVFLAASLPWFIAISVRNPDFPRYAFWQESLLRFATGHAHRGGSFFYYVPVYLGGFFPWSFFLLAAGWNRLKLWKQLREESHKPVAFLLAWVVLIFVFFSISRSKLPGYFLPATIPLSILMAKVWSAVGSEAQSPSPERDWLTAGFAALIGVGLLVAGAPQVFRFAGVQSLLTAKIHPAVLATLRPSLVYTGMILFALGFVGRNSVARARGRSVPQIAFALLVLTVPLVIVRWIGPLRTYAVTSSSRQLARTILASPEKDLPLYGYHYFRTSLPFYLRRPVGLITASDGGEMTSNYITSRFRELRDQLAVAAVSDRRPGSALPPLRAGSERRYRGSPDALGQGVTGDRLLIDATDLRALSHDSLQFTLVLVRNSHVGELMETVGRDHGIWPLWSEWQDSVWKISGPKFKNRK